MEKGWIKLNREIENHWIFQDEKKLKWWLLLLIKVNHKDQKFMFGNRLHVIKRGQSAYSLRTWAQILNTTPKTVSSFFAMLENDNMIEVTSIQPGKQSGIHANTLITIVNYEKYQSKNDVEETTTTTTSKQELPQQVNNNDHLYKNVKNEKNEKNVKNAVLHTPATDEIQVEIETSILNTLWNKLIEEYPKNTYMGKARELFSNLPMDKMQQIVDAAAQLNKEFNKSYPNRNDRLKLVKYIPSLFNYINDLRYFDDQKSLIPRGDELKKNNTSMNTEYQKTDLSVDELRKKWEK
jgi:DNA-binding transcriptional regulator YhcF (GntR family)